MRRSFDELPPLVAAHLGENPAGGHWYVFINRGQVRILLDNLEGRDSDSRLWTGPFAFSYSSSISVLICSSRHRPKPVTPIGRASPKPGSWPRTSA